MSVQLVVVGFTCLLVTLVGARWLAPVIRMPAPTVQFLLGAVLANCLVMAGFDTGLRYQNFHDLVFYLFLPLLVFGAAHEIDIHTFRQKIVPILGLAFGGLLISAGLIALGVYWGIGHPSGFPILAAALTGALLAATDPAAVTGQAAQLPLHEDTAVILEGESLLNDATAVVLFTVFLSLALMPAGTMDLSTASFDAAWLFGLELGGGLVIGTLIGLAGRFICQHSDGTTAVMWTSLAIALIAYFVALEVHASGVIATLISGLLLNPQTRLIWLGKFRRHAREQNPGPTAPAETDDASSASQALADGTIPATTPQESRIQRHVAAHWHLLSSTANGILFALMGATITFAMFSERWLAILIGIAVTLVARFCSVHVILSISQLTIRQGNRISTGGKLPLAQRSLVSFLGMRGSITLALVLILPYDLPYWFTIQSIAYGVVLFDLFVMASIAPFLIRKLSTDNSAAI